MRKINTTLILILVFFFFSCRGKKYVDYYNLHHEYYYKEYVVHPYAEGFYGANDTIFLNKLVKFTDVPVPINEYGIKYLNDDIFFKWRNKICENESENKCKNLRSLDNPYNYYYLKDEVPKRFLEFGILFTYNDKLYFTPNFFDISCEHKTSIYNYLNDHKDFLILELKDTVRDLILKKININRFFSYENEGIKISFLPVKTSMSFIHLDSKSQIDIFNSNLNIYFSNVNVELAMNFFLVMKKVL